MERCTEGKKLVEALGQPQLNPTTAETNILDKVPLLNAASVYAAVMIPETGYFLAKTVNGTHVVSDL